VVGGKGQRERRKKNNNTIQGGYCREGGNTNANRTRTKKGGSREACSSNNVGQMRAFTRHRGGEGHHQNTTKKRISEKERGGNSPTPSFEKEK